MVTRDVLKVLKLHSPTARAILRTFKHHSCEMLSRSYDFLYRYEIFTPRNWPYSNQLGSRLEGLL